MSPVIAFDIAVVAQKVKFQYKIVNGIQVFWEGRGRYQIDRAIRAPDGAKNGLIVPTGQRYAPSAVINDARYCMVMHCIAGFCMVLHCIAWYCMVLHGISWHWIVLLGIAWYYMVLHCIAWYCTVLHGIAWYCINLHYLVLSCTILRIR